MRCGRAGQKDSPPAAHRDYASHAASTAVTVVRMTMIP